MTPYYFDNNISASQNNSSNQFQLGNSGSQNMNMISAQQAFIPAFGSGQIHQFPIQVSNIPVTPFYFGQAPLLLVPYQAGPPQIPVHISQPIAIPTALIPTPIPTQPVQVQPLPPQPPPQYNQTYKAEPSQSPPPDQALQTAAAPVENQNVQSPRQPEIGPARELKVRRGPIKRASDNVTMRKACDICTVQKIRCSITRRGEPCGHCAKMSQECIFSPRKKPTPRDPSLPLGSRKKQKVEKKEELESSLSKGDSGSQPKE